MLYKMQSGLIITCPKHDDVTEYLTYFSKEIIKEAEKKSLKIKEVLDKDLDLPHFSEILKKLDYKLLVLNGHGDSDCIFGYKDNILIKAGKNDWQIKERIIYARSCNAGLVLGKESVRNSKEGCFIGYKLPFVFFMDYRWSTTPHNDNVAKLFLEPSNLIPISIIKGHSTKEAHLNSKKQILKTINKLLKSEGKEETPFFLQALWNNYIGQVIFGNEDARL